MSTKRVFFLIYKRKASLRQRPMSLTSLRECPSWKSIVAKVALMECGETSSMLRPELDKTAALLICLLTAALVMYLTLPFERTALTGVSSVVPG